MNQRQLFILLAIASLLCQLPACVSPCWGAEQIVLRFVENPNTSRAVTRLDDLVEILGGHSPSLEKLLSLPLGPAPRPGQTQSWHSRDVLQHLELRGVHPASIRWSGREQVELQRTEELSTALANTLSPAFVDERIINQASDNVSQAIREYLNLRNGERIDWRIEVKLPVKQAQLLQVRRNIASIGGGTEPWIGEQQFVLQIRNRDTLMSLPVEAVVQPPAMVVMAARPIRRDEILSADALKYASLPRRQSTSEVNYFTKIEDCLGKQVKRSISTGIPLTDDSIGDPIVVSRNDLVAVESISGAIVVSSSAKSLGSGAVGDLIEIELPSRHRLYATVVGQALVQISAVSARTNERR